MSIKTDTNLQLSGGANIDTSPVAPTCYLSTSIDESTPVTPIRTDSINRCGGTWCFASEYHSNTLQGGVEEILTKTAESIATVLDAESDHRLREPLSNWYELHGFSRETKPSPETLVARQAVLQLFLKATLYEYYHQQGDLPAFSGDTRVALQQARETTGNSAFSETVLDDVVWLVGDRELQGVVDERHRLLQSSQPAEEIGELYADLLEHNENRRKLGQVRTPSAISKLMRTWATTGADAVLDPGIGAGVLSRSFHPLFEMHSEPDRIAGIDRSPLSRLMGLTALVLTGHSCDVYTTDFLEIAPGELSTDSDAIVCNPPYTRAGSLSPTYRDTINTQAEQTTGREISAKSPLYAYFIYHARQFLNPGDRAAFIVPHHFLAADYGESLKQYLLSKFNIEALLLFNPGAEAVFENAQTTGVILLLEASDTGATSDDMQFVRLDEQPEMATLRDAIRTGGQGETNWGFVNQVSQSAVTAAENWQPLFEPTVLETDALTPLSELAAVKRGLSTGENDFFCLTQGDVDDRGIDERYLSRLVRSPKTISGYDYRTEDWESHRDSGGVVWLLYHLDAVEGVPDSIDSQPNQDSPFHHLTRSNSLSSVAEYLQDGLQNHETLSTRTVVRNRTPWYQVRWRDPAPILVPGMSRSKFRVVWNESGARHLNNIHGVYPDPSLDHSELKALLAYLNSGFVDEVIDQHTRTYDGGLEKLEPSDLEDLPVLDPRDLSTETVRTLAEHFDELRETARTDASCEPVRDGIDAILTRVLTR